MRKRELRIMTLILGLAVVWIVGRAQEERETLRVTYMHSLSSHTLFDYVRELTAEKYAGRLTGTEEYNDSAAWVADHFKKWGLQPGGDYGTFIQAFPNPYTLVFRDCSLSMLIPYGDTSLKKNYLYEEDYYPGSTSGSGEVTAEVIYVGYGISAPELGYDDYSGLDVKGKIVMMEREAPVGTDGAPELFQKWRPYSFHQYKLRNAVRHGARGMLYNYHIVNPNNAYDAGLIYSHVGENVVSDIFAGTGRAHDEVVRKIQESLKPRSFPTGKRVTIKNTTEHHPEGTGYNVIGFLEGADETLKKEAVILGGHLDHLGMCYEMLPGANDNASAVSVIMGVAEALALCPEKPARSVIFLCFGAEEQGVVGSQYYLEHPLFPLDKTLALINMDGVGCGDKLSAAAAENFPLLWSFFRDANDRYVHRVIRTNYFANLGRPRLDAARFLWKGVPSISFGAFGSPSYYHHTKDDLETITPEIMEDLAQILFMGVLDLADAHPIQLRSES